MDARCPLCSHHLPTVHHILSGCPTALQQGRYTWRHDSTLHTLAKGLISSLPDSRVIVDLPGLRAGENPPSTIPSEVLVTTARPDIVVIRDQQVIFIELTIPFNSPESLANARHRKESKPNYQLALSDLEFRGYRANLTTIEIGTLGHWLPSTRSALHRLLPDIPKSTITALLDRAAKTTISGSQAIFNARQHEAWDSTRPTLDSN